MSNIPDENVPHESAHAEATDAHMRRTSDEGSFMKVPTYTTPTPVAMVDAPSATYVQSEASNTVIAVNEISRDLANAESTIWWLVNNINIIHQVLVDAELIPE